jgi:hypothetical protein
MPETKEQRIQRRLDSAIERTRQEEKIKGGIASIWESMNPGQKLGAAPIPVVSDIAGLIGDIQMYRDEPETRSGLNYALSGLGLLPFVPAGMTKVLDKNRLEALRDLLRRDMKEYEKGESLYAAGKQTEGTKIMDEYGDSIIDLNRQIKELERGDKVFDINQDFYLAKGTDIADPLEGRAYGLGPNPDFEALSKTAKHRSFRPLKKLFENLRGRSAKKPPTIQKHGGFIDKAIIGGSKDI